MNLETDEEICPHCKKKIYISEQLTMMQAAITKKITFACYICKGKLILNSFYELNKESQIMEYFIVFQAKKDKDKSELQNTILDIHKDTFRNLNNIRNLESLLIQKYGFNEVVLIDWKILP